MLRVLRKGPRRESILSTLARELTWTLLFKTAALVALWWLFFSSPADAPLNGEAIGRHVFDTPQAIEEAPHGSGNRR